MNLSGDKSAAPRKAGVSPSLAVAGFYRLTHFRTLAFAAALITAVALGACRARISDDNIDVVNKQFELSEKLGRGGVSPKEVESILGQPQRAETKTIPLETQKKEVEVVRYYYKQDGETIEMHFLDNKLIARVPHFPKKPTSPTPSSK